MKKIIECVPNFSEGRDLAVIKQITDVIESVQGIRLLDVDPGESTNRTVVTFIGEPEPVKEAAFLAVKKASELIDMSSHQGEHSRFGATDVCPFVPVSGANMEDCAQIAQEVGKRIGNELAIPHGQVAVYIKYRTAAVVPVLLGGGVFSEDAAGQIAGGLVIKHRTAICGGVLREEAVGRHDRT